MKLRFLCSQWMMIIATVLFLQPMLPAQTPPLVCADEGKACVTAGHITNASAPAIDGDLGDPAWQVAGVLTFPNDAGGRFIIPDHVPSTFKLYFLHDDINLYIALETHDSMVESADVYENSDGLSGMALERKNQPLTQASFSQLAWFRDIRQCSSSGVGPPVAGMEPPSDRGRLPFDGEWRCKLRGTWNNNSNQDDGYVCEISIPLNDPPNSPNGPFGLGGWQAGDRLRANFVLMDHDGNPGGSYNSPNTSFAKLWWASDNGTDLGSDNNQRFIYLSNAAPVGTPGNDKIVTATRIDSSLTPRIDGIPDDPVWAMARALRFPSSVGRSFTLSSAGYNSDDPSSYTLYFAHDDTYLYVAARTDDAKVESADSDQASDGLISLVFEDKNRGQDHRYSAFWHKLDQWSETPIAVSPIIDCDGSSKNNVFLHFQQGPPQYPYETAKTLWAPSLLGTLDNNLDRDGGYGFELRIPLADLGGYRPGDQIPANIVLIDHDNNPGGAFDNCATDFKKLWWGFDGNEFYPSGPGTTRRQIDPSEERYLKLSSDSPLHAQTPAMSRAARAVAYIAGQQVPYSGFIRSFQDEDVAHTYDNAVALIALTDANKSQEAGLLANALISGLNNDGADAAFLYDAYSAIDKHVSQGTSSGTGPNAWAALALLHYGNAYNAPNARAAAAKINHWIRQRLYDPSDGGVFGGRCHPFEERPADAHAADLTFSFKSTEQVLDTWELCKAFPENSPEQQMLDPLRSWLTTAGKGWTAVDNRQVQCTQNRRFSTGVNPQCRQDNRLFLDPQSWGSIFAVRSGDFDKALGAISATESHLTAATAINSQFVTGFNDSCLPQDNIIWYGGTAQMIVAYHFAGNASQKQRFLDEMAKTQNADGSWNHSSQGSHQQWNEPPCNSYDSFHVAKPHTGETAWNYFALRDVVDGMALPFELVPLANDTSLPVAASGTVDVSGAISCDSGACDSGQIQIQVNGLTKTVFYDGLGANGTSSLQGIVTGIADAFNADPDSPVTATVSQGPLPAAGAGTDWKILFVTRQRGPNVNYQVNTSVNSIMFGQSPQSLSVAPPSPYSGPAGTQNWTAFLSGGH